MSLFSSADASNANSRRASVGLSEIHDEKSLAAAVDIQELTAEDQALIAKFGYKPV